MADKTASNLRGRNVEPRSSILDMQTLDVDASAFVSAPEDGEWVMFGGYLEPATHAVADLTVDAAGMGKGATLCMVWSESGRSDTQALGYKRVPVIFRKSFHCELGLYNYDDAALPTAGDLITVAKAVEVVNGDTGLLRLVADVRLGKDLGAGERWVVGTVLKAVGTAGDPVEVLIFDTPKVVTQL